MKKGLPRELILAVFAAALPASAAVYVWTGAAGTDFADAANWLVGDAVPSAPPANSDSTDLIVLPATVTVNQPVLTTNQDVRGLTIEGAGWTLTTGDFTFRVGPHNVGVTTTYTNGTSAIDGNLRVGTTDTPRTCWTVAGGGVLRIDGTIGRYGNGGGATRKEGNGTLELNTGTTAVNALIVNGGIVRAINGGGGLNKTPLTLSKGVYDLNGNSVICASLNGTPQSAIVNNETNEVLLASEFRGNQTLGTHLSGNFGVNWTHNGIPRTVTIANPTNDYVGATTLADGITLVLQADSPLGEPGCLGLSAAPVAMGDQSGNGGGTAGFRTSVLTDGPYTVGQSFAIGTHKPRRQLGATAGQVGTSTFSGNVRVGLGSAYNGDNPHLYIVAGPDAWVEFTGNITNATTYTGSQRIRKGSVYMEGPGGARLSGDNDYAGGTIVSNGILIAASPTALGVAGATVAGGVLGGTATVRGLVTVASNAVLTAGEIDAAGTLTLAGGLTLEAGAVLAIQVAGAAADRVEVTGGSLSVTAPVTVDVEVLEAPTAGRRAILDWSGAAGSPDLADFALGAGAGEFRLLVADNVLYLKPLGPSATLFLIR
jgi:autotransporter-associated beta strand protein